MPLELAHDLATLALYDIVIFADDSGSMIFEEGGERINDLKVIMGRVAEVATMFDEDGTPCVCDFTPWHFHRQCHVTSCQYGCTSHLLSNLSSSEQCTVASKIGVCCACVHAEGTFIDVSHVPFHLSATVHIVNLRDKSCTPCHARPVKRMPLSRWCACLQV
jgi:hypothetical protein